MPAMCLLFFRLLLCYIIASTEIVQRISVNMLGNRTVVASKVFRMQKRFMHICGFNLL